MNCQPRRSPWPYPTEEDFFPENLAPMGKEDMRGVPHLCEHQEQLLQIRAQTLNPNHDLQRTQNAERCLRFGVTQSQLQYKWRDPETLPEVYNPAEAEAAILDALVGEGGVPAWSGDGSGCAEQIVRAVWQRGEIYKKELEEIKAKLKSITG